MFTDANENLRIVSYFRGYFRHSGLGKGIELVGARPTQVVRVSAYYHCGHFPM
jgi:hypothetical protein